MTVELSTKGAVIKTAYEAEDDTNALTDARLASIGNAVSKGTALDSEDQDIYGNKTFYGQTRFDSQVYFGNGTLTTDDEFYAYASNSTSSAIQFDAGDTLQYDRSADTYDFRIGFSIQLTLSATQADFKDNAVVTTGGIRPGGSTGPRWFTGSGTPEGAVNGVVGSLFTRTDGGSSTTLYVKESGAATTGWVAK